VRALEATAPIPVQRQRTLHAVIAELAETQGDAPALLSAGENLTYAELAARANRFARWALMQNLAKGEIVCLMMPNRPEYLAIWLGLTGVGVTPIFAASRSPIASISLSRRTSLYRRGTERAVPFRRGGAQGRTENLVARRRRV
jgi:acyl-CoA synthetase (AMP-forming)/AMP-acid ligase II